MLLSSTMNMYKKAIEMKESAFVFTHRLERETMRPNSSSFQFSEAHRMECLCCPLAVRVFHGLCSQRTPSNRRTPRR